MRVTKIDDPISKLTDAQREVLRLVMAGFKSKEISFQLGIGEDAVNKRLAAAKSVLGTTSRFVAARRLAAFEAQDQTYHSLAGQFLAVEDEPDSGEPAGHEPGQDLSHERPSIHLQVSEPTPEYDAGAAETVVAVASAQWRLAATPTRVFLLTFITGVIAALLLRI